MNAGSVVTVDIHRPEQVHITELQARDTGMCAGNFRRETQSLGSLDVSEHTQRRGDAVCSFHPFEHGNRGMNICG